MPLFREHPIELPGMATRTGGRSLHVLLEMLLLLYVFLLQLLRLLGVLLLHLLFLRVAGLPLCQLLVFVILLRLQLLPLLVLFRGYLLLLLLVFLVRFRVSGALQISARRRRQLTHVVVG